MKNEKYRNIIILATVTVVFSLMVILIDKAPIGPANTSVGFSHLNGWVAGIFPFKKGLYTLTNILGYLAILVCVGFGAIGAGQLWVGKSLKKVDRNVIALGVLYIVVIALYVFFEKAEINYRPVIMPNETAPEASFPSSHTMLAMVVFGSAPEVLKKYVRDLKIMNIIKIVCYALAVITVVGRLVAGVHWFTDIIASVLISLTLLEIFKAVLEIIASKKKSRNH